MTCMVDNRIITKINTGLGSINSNAGIGRRHIVQAGTAVDIYHGNHPLLFNAC